MPNHFHIMMQVNTVVVDHATITRSATLSRAPSNSCTPKTTNLNKEIGILLASYTRAINNQNDWAGSIFRQKTKAECLTKQNGFTPSFYDTEQGTKMHIPNSNYPQNCFNYIHQNPVKAGFVKKPIDWEFSSYQDYYGNRNDNIINIAATKKAGIII
jgi:putative transposase